MRVSTCFALAGFSLALLPGASLAADVVQPVDEVPPIAEVPSLYSWNGLYVGVSGGYIDPTFSLNVPFGTNEDVEFGDGGGLIGGTIGYNRQFGRIVAGVEADISYADLNGKIEGADDPFGFGFETNGDGDYFATIRGRLGFAFDRVLVYGTGGVAFVGLDVETPAGEISDDKNGYTVGGGVEYAFTDHLSAKGEYLYADFDDDTASLFPGDVETSFDVNVFRVGLNYKF